MTTVNIHEAKTQFSRLVDNAASGETVVIAKAGRPVAKLTRVDADPPVTRLGFLSGAATIPDDFDTMGADDLSDTFEGA